jgi:hypothetical protein
VRVERSSRFIVIFGCRETSRYIQRSILQNANLILQATTSLATPSFRYHRKITRLPVRGWYPKVYISLARLFFDPTKELVLPQKYTSTSGRVVFETRDLLGHVVVLDPKKRMVLPQRNTATSEILLSGGGYLVGNTFFSAGRSR